MELTVDTTPLSVADSTGAGDAFDAGFLSVILGADDPHAALGRAAILRRAARAGHRAARLLLSEPRAEIDP